MVLYAYSEYIIIRLTTHIGWFSYGLLVREKSIGEEMEMES